MPKELSNDPNQLDLFNDFNTVTRLHMFGRVTTRLVRESSDDYEGVQVSSPADVAAILHEYFRDKDREEFLIVLLNTATSLAERGLMP